MILLTGATGFVGKHLLNKLKNQQIRCLIRRDVNLEGIELVKGDLTDVRSLEEATKNISIVIHLAAVIKSNRREEFEKINIEGTKNLVSASIKNKIKKFIYISSHDATLGDKYDYAYSKLEAEKIVKNSELNYTILRPTVIYGKNDKESLGMLFDMIKKYPFAPVIGDGNYQLQPVHIEDVVDMIIKCLDSAKSEKTYFVAGPEPLTFNEIVNKTSKALSKKIIKIHFPLWLLKTLLKPYEILSKNPSLTYKKILAVTENKTCDISETEKELGFKPVTFEEGLKKTLF